MSLFSELKRRNVIRMAGLYLIVSWLVVQVADTLLPMFGAPAWLPRSLVLLLAIGFLPALAFAWIYEITPEGLKRDKEVDPAQSIAPLTGKRMNRLIVVALVLALAYFGIDKYLLAPHRPVPAAAQASGKDESTIGDHAINRKSIAVLPFENLSVDKANGYFADGIQDQILTSLAQIGDLKVISRTSTQKYASHPESLKRIARELGVANILEGSVQKAGDEVRINVQLIRATSDSHLWAQTYDRTLKNVFAVQSEVAEKIANSLNARLTHDERQTLSRQPTDVPAAYEAYLRGRALDASGYDLPTERKAASAYAEAVRLDPYFLQAWSDLAGVTSYLYFNGVDPAHYTADYVKQAADAATRVQPDSDEARMARGYYRYRVLRDFAGAGKAFAAVLRHAPNNPGALQYMGLTERRQGKWQQSVEHLEKASVRDPRNPGLMTIIAVTYMNMGRFEVANSWLDRALALAPGSNLALYYKVMICLYQGRLADAAQLLDSVPMADEPAQIANIRTTLYFYQRRYDRVIAELKPLLARPDSELNGWGPTLAVYLGQAQAYVGEKAQAHVTFQRVVDRLKPQADRVDDSIMPILLAKALAGLGEYKQALAQARHALKLYDSDAIYRRNALATLAGIQAATGDHEAAISNIKELLREHGLLTRANLRLDPTWDPLRKDPRFQALLKQKASERMGAI